MEMLACWDENARILQELEAGRWRDEQLKVGQQLGVNWMALLGWAFWMEMMACWDEN